MTSSGKFQAALGLHRFGFGPARDQIAKIAADPRGAILADLERADAGRIAAGELPSSAESARAVAEFDAEAQAKAKLQQRAKKLAEGNVATADAAGAQPPGDGTTDAKSEPNPAPKEPPLPQRLFQSEAKAHFDAAIGADIGFVERLVWFWSNHFCISADKVISVAGPYEREAIRPHVLGRFVDMLQAVESHPAMLFYLDNFLSMGPNSVAGINRDKGLNENLAREILELHTLGVGSGYTQADVTSFAKVLTGWTFVIAGQPIYGGQFFFFQRLHEPGDQTVLDKRYPDTGMAQGTAVLADLARHPATAQHIALKLARHFVADEPPPSLVEKLATTFRDTGGDLKDVAKALVNADESWTPQRQKLKTPAVWLVAMQRLIDRQALPPNAIGRILNAQAMLGQALWRPPAPNGYADTEDAWIDGVPRRLDIANNFATRVGANLDPLALLENDLGPLASAATRDTVARAESRTQGLALLVMAPEFLRS